MFRRKLDWNWQNATSESVNISFWFKYFQLLLLFSACKVIICFGKCKNKTDKLQYLKVLTYCFSFIYFQLWIHLTMSESRPSLFYSFWRVNYCHKKINLWGKCGSKRVIKAQKPAALHAVVFNQGSCCQSTHGAV